MEKGVVVEFKRPFDNQIPDWIRTLAKKHELRMPSDAVDLFHQLVGSNLQDINAELGKLAQFMGGKKQVGVDDVLKAVSRIRLDSVFDLTDAIGNNDRARALDCLVNLLDNGQNEVGVLALISRHVRILKTRERWNERRSIGRPLELARRRLPVFSPVLRRASARMV